MQLTCRVFVQVTFQAEALAGDQHTRRVLVAGLELNVFTHSFLGFGQDSAQLRALQLAAAELPAAAGASPSQVLRTRPLKFLHAIRSASLICLLSSRVQVLVMLAI